MLKGFIGILTIAILFLVALNVRLTSRIRALEDQLAEKPRSLPSAAPIAPAPEPVPAAAAAVPAAHPTNVARAPKPAPAAPPSPPASSRPDSKDGKIDALGTPEGKALQTLTSQALHLAYDGATRNATLRLPAEPAQAPEPESTAGRRPGFLGIQGEDVPGGGVRISGVIPSSVAAASGLQPNDILLEYNGQRVESLASLTDQIRGAGEGSPASLRIRRGGTDFYQGVQLGAPAGAPR